MKRGYVFAAILVVVASLLAATALYPSLPERVPTHWNARGQVDGYGPRGTIFIFPVLLSLMLVSFWVVLPAISPKHYQVESFRGTYDYVMFCVVALVAYIQGITLWNTVQGPLDPGRGLIGGISVFVILMGNVLGKVRRNFWLGVRTPWTLADERVWNATHRVAGWVFVVTGALGLLVVATGLPMAVAAVLLAGAVLIIVVYSLIYYKRLERRGEL